MILRLNIIDLQGQSLKVFEGGLCGGSGILEEWKIK